MPPGVVLTPSATPADFSRPSPAPDFGHALALGSVQTPFEAKLRYVVKLSVVPESSERKKTWIASDGNVTPLLSAAIAGSFHVLMSPWKIFAVTSAFRTSLPTPERLYATAIGPVTMGRFQAGLAAQRVAAAATSPLAALSAESEPAKSTWAALNCVMPAPEPVGL